VKTRKRTKKSKDREIDDGNENCTKICGLEKQSTPSHTHKRRRRRRRRKKWVLFCNNG
jgi:hypothetical protein